MKSHTIIGLICFLQAIHICDSRWTNRVATRELSTRAPSYTPLWIKCQARGRKVYDILQAARTDPGRTTVATDKQGGDGLMAAYDIVTSPDTLTVPVSLMDEFDAIGYSPFNYRKVQVKIKNSRQDPMFDNLFNAREGVIFAIDNQGWRGGDQRQLKWSEAAFQSYSQMARDQGMPLDRLGRIYRYNVANDEAVPIVEEAYDIRGSNLYGGYWEKWTYAENPEAFLALLGTENGAGVGYLLSDHAAAFGKMNVEAIYTMYKGEWLQIYFKVF
ncbi:hypothetical protein ONS95_013467 [Cadophora gregata]|uniref:uncharacterized protein n=1 Tax=Cadophora gregata TaxID=51156 RepID=UPI0026DBBDD6|nr:uncharacterized protein ONS95_013467 [Cadophora gregata]KAK0099637.1 hypothetical protein ONS96_008136 [Cadophora gregata f. sp. sojae]KAK0116452.1 hypothetical protein ONS95_013467 [Cadophora gregata]